MTWFKGNSQIKQSRYFVIGSERDLCTLQITEAFPEDEGIYRCSAVTSVGTVTTEANLRVLSKCSSNLFVNLIKHVS